MPDLSFGSYTLPVYLYENFSYVISNSSAVQLPITKTSGLPSNFFTTTSSNLTFAGNGSSLTAGSTESFSYTLVNTLSSSNTVPVGTGRFTDLSGNGVSGTSYTFYKNEPIPTIHLMAPFALSSAVSSVPSLPPGLKFFVSGSNLDISGTPLTTLPTSNYLLIGKDAATGSKIVTTSNTYTVSNERILYNLSGTSIVNMDVGVPIATRALTAAFPPYPSGGTLKYTWNTFPDGINVFDFNNSNRTISNNFGFLTTDPSHAFVMAGTPSLAAAYLYANAGVSSATYTIQGTRVSPLPAVISNFAVTFAFNETVLFDQSAIPTLYSGVPVDPSANFFRARTYFNTGSGTNIASIFSPDLRADLSLTRIGSNAYLSGTPTLGASSANYTIRATNSNGFTQEYVTPITVQDDFITFVSPTPAVDACFNFILSRPLDVPKTGYYSSPIQFKAQAASGLPVTLSAPALAGTGMTLDSSGIISGFPDTVTALTALAVTAVATGSPATATRNTNFAVLNDIFTFGTVPTSNFTFIQNRVITPFQIPVTTLSERPINNFSEVLLPSGLNISPAGVISGTPLSSDVSGTIEIIPTTGYASGSAFYNYTLTPDSILFTVPQNIYNYLAGDPVSVQVTGTAYSGTTVSNYDLSMTQTYGLNIDSTSGFIDGPWVSGIPPNVLPSSCNFTVNGTAGVLLGSLGANVTTNPYFANESLVAVWGNGAFGPAVGLFGSSNVHSNWDLINVSGGSNSGSISDIQFKVSSPTDVSVLIATNSGIFIRGTTLANFQQIPFDPNISVFKMSTIANKPNTSTWFAAGSKDFGGDPFVAATMIRSDDDAVTWDISSSPILVAGQYLYTHDQTGGGSIDGPYLAGGAALRYKNGVLMVGGSYNSGLGSATAMARSSDEGSNWSPVTGGFSDECASYSLDDSNIWIATGSESYQTGDAEGYPPYTGPSSTIKYSTDNGSNWSNATGGFSMFGYEVVYASNTWFATGISGFTSPSNYYNIELRYSTNGSNWFLANLAASNLFGNRMTRPLPPLPLGSLNFDGTNWNVFVELEDPTPSSSTTFLYKHDLSSSFASNWIAGVIINPYFFGPDFPVSNDGASRFISLTPPNYIKSAEGDINVNLTFYPLIGTGPTITAPSTRSYLLYQYVPITPIQLAATGTGQLYFFVSTGTLPAGLTFDPLTNVISGTPAQIGSTSTICYVKDDNGVSTVTITFTVIIPRIVRKQDGAGAYTSLLRQYTNVLGAQNARDNRVLPNQTLGEFMAPDAPDVITNTIGCDC